MAPVQSLTELLTLVDYGCEPFDVVVINAELAARSLDLLGFFLDNPQIRQALIYNEGTAPLQQTSGFAQENVQISHLTLPSKQSISQLMALVDVHAKPGKPAAHKPHPLMQYVAHA
ncbi:hypothetical protein D3C81_1269950 [compost metagenome]